MISRRALLTAALAAPCLAACGATRADVPATSVSTGTDPATLTGTGSATGPARPPDPVRIAYGDDASQWGELHLPAGDRRPGTVVIVHGGFWLAEYGADLGTPLAADLAARGWVVWNLEYRRVGDCGGWPTTLDDVAAGVDQLASIASGERYGAVDTDRVVAIGHSAGGQLAAWAAARPHLGSAAPSRFTAGTSVAITGVVSQAGVLELATAAADGVGGSAVPGLVGGMPADVPDRYRIADPAAQLPLGVPVHCVHGDADDNVPLSQSTTYVDAAVAAGDTAELHRITGDHFTLIDPTSDAWRTVVDLLPGLIG